MPSGSLVVPSMLPSSNANSSTSHTLLSSSSSSTSCSTSTSSSSSTKPSSLSSGNRDSHISIMNAVAGALAGISSSLYTNPLDVVKTRIQNQSTYQIEISETLKRSFVPYKGTLATLGRILKEEGIRGWYRGLGLTIAGYLPTWSIYFTSYNEFKRIFSLNDERLLSHPLVHLVSAVSAGAVSSTATNPLWVIRTRLMLQSSRSLYHYDNSWDAFKNILKFEGIRGLYKGLLPSLIGTAHVAIQFPIYELLKSHLSNESQSLDTFAVLCASSISKTIASVVSYPHEVIRTRLQHQSTEQEVRYRGVIHAVLRIYKEESLIGFYKGICTNLVKVVPASALTFVTYEIILSHLYRHFGKIEKAD